MILRAQRVKRILDLLINFRLFNSALQDDRSIRRNEMRQLLRLRSGFRHAAQFLACPERPSERDRRTGRANASTSEKRELIRG